MMSRFLSLISRNVMKAENGRKFGTFGGVFTPTVLTILGVIMYLRTGQLVLIIYSFLVRQNLKTLPSDVRSGLFFSIAEWAVKRASQMPSAPERTWKPAVLMPVASTSELTGSYRFLWAMTSPRGAVQAMGIVLLSRHEIVELGREQLINVWVSNQGPDWTHDLRLSNLDLAILIAYQLAQNWNGRINLCMAVQDDDTHHRAEKYLRELIQLARLPAQTKVIVLQCGFINSLTQVPRADLSIFGLPKPSDITFCQRVVGIVDSSCVFVRDSGDESALA